MFFISICLYGLLGTLLAWGGIVVTEKPAQFVAIILVVAIIDHLKIRE